MSLHKQIVKENVKNYVKIHFFNQFLTDYFLMIIEFAYL